MIFKKEKVLVLSKMLSLVVLLLSLIACGGAQIDDPSPTVENPPCTACTTSGVPANVVITSTSIFGPQFVGRDMIFKNGYGATTHMRVEQPAAFIRTNPDGTLTQITWGNTSQVAGRAAASTLVLHFFGKTADNIYWGMNVHNAELFFPLHLEAGGSYRSTSSLINMPNGCPWCGPTGLPSSAPFIATAQVVDTKPGMPPPYMFVPPTLTGAQRITYETRVCSPGVPGLTLDDFLPATQPLCGTNDGEYWRTDFYIAWVDVPGVYTGWSSVAEAWEGLCGHELYYWAPNLGPVKVDSPYDGGEIKGNPVCKYYNGGVHVFVNGQWTTDQKLNIVRQ